MAVNQHLRKKNQTPNQNFHKENKMLNNRHSLTNKDKNKDNNKQNCNKKSFIIMIIRICIVIHKCPLTRQKLNRFKNTESSNFFRFVTNVCKLSGGMKCGF